MKYDVVIIGSGPAGLLAAHKLCDSGLSIAILEKGMFSSGGLMNDCKLTLHPEASVDMEELSLGRSETEKYISEIDSVFLDHGANPTLSGSDSSEVDKLVSRAKRCRARLIPYKSRHIGTDMSKILISNFRTNLEKKGVRFLLETEVSKISPGFKLLTNKGEINSKYVIAAPGREGAYWFRDSAHKLGVDYKWGPIDVGIRVEVLSDVYDPVTDYIYDPKFKFNSRRYNDKLRTFCTNKGGFVRVEKHNGFKLVNGDALKKVKSANTNFAILNTIELTEPYADTTEFGRTIARECCRLGGGKPLIQKMGDFLEGRRSKKESFKSEDLVKPTLPFSMVAPGDISLALCGRIVDNLRDSIDVLDRIIPGVAHPSTIIYAPEIKFYDTKYITDKFLETNVPGLFVAGDGAGKSRGIVGAALSGILAAKGILQKS